MKLFRSNNSNRETVQNTNDVELNDKTVRYFRGCGDYDYDDCIMMTTIAIMTAIATTTTPSYHRHHRS
ncbi:hypothetical protein [Dictyobacter kobayashii]|uniref:Uncharacterized protein n=1 Tax=Dictyobacter kobayashii TaxID=2014872 RepID=A0A402AQ46_9CHLR|nr:hypothetical protein [Dictyobacter kobayashii]GCE21120.1 hypothetical protein KDK_49200 [Dictyobacter kobayashii]